MIRFTKDAKLENLVERPSESLPKNFSKFGSDLVSSSRQLVLIDIHTV